MEHVNLYNNGRFQNALVEEPWTDGKALVPGVRYLEVELKT